MSTFEKIYKLLDICFKKHFHLFTTDILEIFHYPFIDLIKFYPKSPSDNDKKELHLLIKTLNETIGPFEYEIKDVIIFKIDHFLIKIQIDTNKDGFKFRMRPEFNAILNNQLNRYMTEYNKIKSKD